MKANREAQDTTAICVLLQQSCDNRVGGRTDQSTPSTSGRNPREKLRYLRLGPRMPLGHRHPSRLLEDRPRLDGLAEPDQALAERDADGHPVALCRKTQSVLRGGRGEVSLLEVDVRQSEPREVVVGGRRQRFLVPLFSSRERHWIHDVSLTMASIRFTRPT